MEHFKHSNINCQDYILRQECMDLSNQIPYLEMYITTSITEQTVSQSSSLHNAQLTDINL